jgi:hypothetical protein
MVLNFGRIGNPNLPAFGVLLGDGREIALDDSAGTLPVC